MKAPNKSLEHSGSVVVPQISKDPVMLGPNITGSFGAAIGGNVETDSTGPFWSKSIVGGRSGWSGDGGTIYGFDVSRSDGTYGKASTVQPASLQLMPCIKS